jgi:hypothetical protein
MSTETTSECHLDFNTLWSLFTSEEKLCASRALIIKPEEHLKEDALKTLDLFAEAMNFRPQYVRSKMDKEYVAQLLSKRLAQGKFERCLSPTIRSWLLREHRPLMISFLSAMDVKNNNGMILDGVPPIEGKLLEKGIKHLQAKHHNKITGIYFGSCAKSESIVNAN